MGHQPGRELSPGAGVAPGGYRVAGVAVHSAVPLPGFPAAPAAGAAAVTVRRIPLEEPGPGWEPAGQEGGEGAPARLRWWHAERADGRWYRYRFDYREHAIGFVISPDGAQVGAEWSAGVGEADVEALLAGPFLGRALRLRGLPCLHASAVAVDGAAVALLGASRAGKSTFAAALAAAGCALLSDDMAACLPRAGGGYVAARGARRVRLWGDAAARLGAAAGAARRVWPGIAELEKYVLPLPAHDAVPEELPLRGIYLLMPRAAGLHEPRVEAVPPAQRLALLAAQVYGTLELPRAARARELAWVARLAASVPVRRLTLPDDLGGVGASAAWFLRHLRTAAAA